MPQRCPTCDERCSNAHDLAVHRADIHHRCRICNSDFDSKKVLIQHCVLFQHEYYCLSCGKGWESLRAFGTHKCNIHPQEDGNDKKEELESAEPEPEAFYTCGVCSIRYRTQTSLVQHWIATQHEFYCVFYEKAWAELDAFATHACKPLQGMEAPPQYTMHRRHLRSQEEYMVHMPMPEHYAVVSALRHRAGGNLPERIVISNVPASMLNNGRQRTVEDAQVSRRAMTTVLEATPLSTPGPVARRRYSESTLRRLGSSRSPSSISWSLAQRQRVRAQLTLAMDEVRNDTDLATLQPASARFNQIDIESSAIHALDLRHRLRWLSSGEAPRAVPEGTSHSNNEHNWPQYDAQLAAVWREMKDARRVTLPTSSPARLVHVSASESLSQHLRLDVHPSLVREYQRGNNPIVRDWAGLTDLELREIFVELSQTLIVGGRLDILDTQISPGFRAWRTETVRAILDERRNRRDYMRAVSALEAMERHYGEPSLFVTGSELERQSTQAEHNLRNLPDTWSPYDEEFEALRLGNNPWGAASETSVPQESSSGGEEP